MLKTVTYSPAYTLVPTYECFNRCSYCNFRREPGDDDWMSLARGREILQSLRDGVGPQVTEILILSGEVHPQHPRRSLWFQRIFNLCQLALSLGFLPHTNVGPLSEGEMASLKTVNVSMGLMLEQVTPKLLKTVHRHAPSKQPEQRILQLELAGKLRIPFTTGLLLGIGETPKDWCNSLLEIARIHSRWGHIQEVILQPHRLGQRQESQFEAFELQRLPEVVALARGILPSEVTLQIPPNLLETPEILLDCLAAGARDLGGIGPRDEVNPDYPHWQGQRLREILEPAGWRLVPRLPVYTQFEQNSDAFPQLAERQVGVKEPPS
ncbi:7,8-didemethyl-8-hydroxy-5-deazariboflavin synthase subunit CofG [Geitlerinema sp. P-1104]|uniref:7,8-didemethyl-8-hydroxy-5-deazariboflavin synthase subunit CofG n=1 Tax=Geitlerinema sp. P-1104 TaxID=2546230 RepID=UPI001477527B|nr:7,8-didemethyl-8-hydroxy-5-deazariboflavin synthase subunit CofG [Geitlerinema sp. P-1104]NMG59837.1 7,8-didemethyl-8-hydroxy-5-deazariboflavin synthase subunit CofG [Geitlerinema sp. P-1104]